MTDRNNAPIKLGHVVTTPAAFRLMLKNGVDPFSILDRHATGDWSEMDVADQLLNKHAAATDLRVFSAYRVNDVDRVWVITEGDRSVTTILLPSEY